jgi:hypothetical protein
MYSRHTGHSSASCRLLEICKAWTGVASSGGPSAGGASTAVASSGATSSGEASSRRASSGGVSSRGASPCIASFSDMFLANLRFTGKLISRNNWNGGVNPYESIVMN